MQIHGIVMVNFFLDAQETHQSTCYSYESRESSEITHYPQMKFKNIIRSIIIRRVSNYNVKTTLFQFQIRHNFFDPLTSKYFLHPRVEPLESLPFRECGGLLAVTGEINWLGSVRDSYHLHKVSTIVATIFSCNNYLSYFSNNELQFEPI